MKKWISLSGFLLVMPSALATPEDLTGGVFITHYVPEVTFSWDPPSPCEAYGPYAITSCAQQCTRVDTDSTLAIVIFILAAWTEDKEFGGVEFGMGDYSYGVFLPTGWDPCFPPSGGLLIPACSFPSPENGTVFVAVGEPWRGNFVPVLWLAGNASAQSGVVPLSEDPATHFAGTSNWEPPYIGYRAVALGALGINTDGLPVCPGDPAAACCLADGSCWLLSVFENCNMLGGVWHPDWIACDPNPCVETPVRVITWGQIKRAFR